MIYKKILYIYYELLLVCSIFISHHTICAIAKNQENKFELLSHQINTRDPTDIPVNIHLNPVEHLHGKDYVITNTNLTATAEILDEKFKNMTLTYQWSVKNKTIITDTKASQISYVFDKPDEDNFLKLLVLHQPNNTGTSVKSLVVRDGIKISDPDGKLFLEHGELLDITMKIQGTKPFNYCFKFCEEKEIDDCKCKLDKKIDDNLLIKITHYLRKVGNYTLLISVDNIADHKDKYLSVKIIDNTRGQTIPYIPIISSISAVLILLSGIALHLQFKKTIITETADFDFIRQTSYDEEVDWGEEQSFWQRVRYLLFRAEQDDQADNGNLNNSSLYGSRSRLIN